MFSNTLLMPIFLSGLSAFIATIGLITVAMRSDWSRRYAHLFAVMASGLLLTMVITHLAPEALKGHPQAPLFMLGGFFMGLLVHDTLRLILPVSDPRTLAAGLTPLIAISIHSFLDGIVYTVTFAQNISTGVYATMGLLIHEFPEGVIAFALLRGAGFSNRHSFILAFMGAALTTPMGAILSIPVTYSTGEDTLSLMFAVSAGLLLFVSTGPLMQHMSEDRPTRTLPALAVGVIIAIIVAQGHMPHIGQGAEDTHKHHDFRSSNYISETASGDEHEH